MLNTEVRKNGAISRDEIISALDTMSLQSANELIRTKILGKAANTGSITYDDILKLLPNAEQNISLLENYYG